MKKEYWTENGTRIAAGQVWGKKPYYDMKILGMNGKTIVVETGRYDELNLCIETFKIEELLSSWSLKQDSNYPLNLCDLEEGKEYEAKNHSGSYSVHGFTLRYHPGYGYAEDMTSINTWRKVAFRELRKPTTVEFEGKTYDREKFLERLNVLDEVAS